MYAGFYGMARQKGLEPFWLLKAWNGRVLSELELILHENEMKRKGFIFMFIMMKLAGKFKLIDNGNKHKDGIVTVHFNTHSLII